MAAVALAPLAAAHIRFSGNIQAVIDALIKRTTVNGGGRIVQTILVKNTANTKAPSVQLGSLYSGDDNRFLKGHAKTPGSARVKMVKDSSFNIIKFGDQAVTIPAGKTLKATLTWKAETCPPADANVFNWSPPFVGIKDNAICLKFAPGGVTKVRDGVAGGRAVLLASRRRLDALRS